MTTTVPVTLPGRSYDVAVGAGNLAALGEVVRDVAPGARAMLVVDHNLPEDAVAGAVDALRGAGFTVAQQVVEAEEDRKTLRTMGELLRAAAGAGLERRDPWVALGGGIVGDVAGFAAASYQRGAPVVQCPTTLLAMVDASVGGKTGVNLRVPARATGAQAGETDWSLLKNYLGAFWQPRAVIADVGTLGSLPDRELRCGLAECLKHAVVASGKQPGLLGWTVERVGAFLARDLAALEELVAINVGIKAAVVEWDEREEAASSAGGRAVLNLGHTFAHAIEPLPALGLRHGEAVGLGLIAAAHASAALGELDDPKPIAEAVAAAGLPTTVAGLPGDADLIARMRSDKKTRGGALRLVIPVRGGCRVVEEPGEAALAAGWSAVRG